jgi:hypothetical protein
MSTILIGCKLPHGVKFKGADGEYIHINGLNTCALSGPGVFGITHVDETEWALFVSTHTDFVPLLNNSIFTVGNTSVADIAAMADDLSGEKTGFEGLNPHKPAPNLEAENKKVVDEALNQTRTSAAKKPRNKADKAAAAELAANLGSR